jgi:hypothetical protein
MTVKEWAEKISGIEYPANELQKLSKEMAADGVIAAYGDSDDLMEFRGAIDDEIGAFDGVEARLFRRADGTAELLNVDMVEKNQIHEFNSTQIAQMSVVKAAWYPKELEASWLIETEIPHEKFDIMEDGKLFCRGAVFHIDDVRRIG